MKANEVLELIASEYKVPMTKVMSDSRKKPLPEIRRMFAYIMLGKISYKQIAKTVDRQGQFAHRAAKKAADEIFLYGDTRKHYHNILNALKNEIKTEQEPA